MMMLLLHFSRSFFKLSALVDICLSFVSAWQCFGIEGELILKRIDSKLFFVQLRGYSCFEKF